MNRSRFPRRSRRWPRTLVVAFLLVVAAGAGLTTASTRPSPAIVEEELGRLLFWDPVLSGPMDVSCATCHHPDFAYADGRALSLGPGAVGLGPDRVVNEGAIPVAQRNSPTLLNVAYNGLDRQRRQLIRSVKATLDGRNLRLTAECDGDVLLERWTVAQKKDLFEETFGLRVVIDF